MNNTSFLELVYFFGACVGVFLATALLLRQRSISNGLLSFMMVLFSFYLIEQSVYLSGDLKSFPHLMFATLPLTFLIGPLFYHFIRLNVREDSTFRLIHLTHLLPFLYETAILVPFYLLPAERKLEIYQQLLTTNDNSVSFNLYFLGFIIYLISTMGFIFYSHRILQQSSIGTGGKRRLLRWISISFLVYLTLNVIALATGIFFPDMIQGWQHFSLILLTAIILSIGYICFLYPEVIVLEEQKEKYINSSLTSDQIVDYAQKLKKLMAEEKAYLQEALTPKELLDPLGITSNDLSRILSEGLNTNFYRFVNEYRVNHAKNLLRSTEYGNAKMVHVAIDSGFGNKTSFLRNFKAMTGMTPSLYKSSTTHLSEPMES